MKSKPGITLLLMLLAFILVIGILLRPGRGRPKAVDNSAPDKTTLATPTPRPPKISTPRPTVEAKASEEANEPDPMRLPREKVEEYLQRNHRNVSSLLAAYHAMNDTNYLREAATNFPGDPQLQWTVLAQNIFPEDRRKWLDAFKTSSPDNSLANYLSATDYFKNGQPDAALAELQAAAGKSQFENYTMKSRLDTEELCLASGLTQVLASTVALSGVTTDLMLELASFKQLATGVAEVQKQHNAAGNPSSAENAAQLGLLLADQLRSGDCGKLVISHLVGNADEVIMLNQLDQNTSYAFLGGKTPAQRLEELKQFKTEFRQLNADFQMKFMQMSESEQISFLQHQKIYGELEAMRWLQQKQNTATGSQ